MSSTSKARIEIDKAVRHLIDYIDASTRWAPLFDELMDQFLAPVADHFDQDLNTIAERLLKGPHSNMTFGFLFEEMAVSRWNNETQSPIEDYLKKRGWREGPHGRRYLRAMQDSTLELYEVTAVEPGHWVDVRPWGSDTQIIRVKEKEGSRHLHTWDWIVVRILEEGKSRAFTGSILPLTLHSALQVQAAIAAVPEELAGYYREMVEEGDVEGVPDNLENEIGDFSLDKLTHLSFERWAIDFLEATTGNRPEMLNTDNERIVISRFRFPLIGESSAVARCLSSHPDIVEDAARCYSWIRPGETRTVLGRLRLDEPYLRFETNSAERGQRGIELFSKLLGAQVGQAMGVHENLDDNMNDAPPGNADSNFPQDSLRNHPDAMAMVEKHLKEHYRKTLDEPLPMLNDKSPRACAGDPVLRDQVVTWLKYLENMSARAPGPAFDHQWMWEELGLSDFRK